MVVGKVAVSKEEVEKGNIAHSKTSASTTGTMSKKALTQIETKSEAPNLPSATDKAQKHREYMKEYYRRNREKVRTQHSEYYWRNRDRLLESKREYYQKNRERIREKFKERCDSDSEYRERQVKIQRMWWEKRREALKELKIVLGGKCKVCGESDLDVLQPHHPDGKERRGRSFINSKEFGDWVKHRIIPGVILLCANHHQKLHITEARGEQI